MVSAISNLDTIPRSLAQSEVKQPATPIGNKLKGIAVGLASGVTSTFMMYGTPVVSTVLSSNPVNLLRLFTIDSILFLSLWEVTKKLHSVADRLFSGKVEEYPPSKIQIFCINRTWKSYQRLVGKVLALAISVSSCAASYIYLSYWVLSHPVVNEMTFSYLTRLVLLSAYIICRISAGCFYELAKK